MISFTITNKQRPRATLVMLVSFYGKQYRKSIGMGIPARYWNGKKKCARHTADFNGEAINEHLRQWTEYGQQVVKYFTDRKISPTNEEFSTVLAHIIDRNARPTSADGTFSRYFEETYIPRYRSVRSPITVKKYVTVLHQLQRFEQETRCRLYFSNIDIEFYNRFQAWFYRKGYSANYFGLVIKTVKQVFREAAVYDKLHTCNGIEHRDFITVNERSDSVYLNEEELTRIRTLRIDDTLIRRDNAALSDENIAKKAEALRRARSLFLIGCYTGLRVSDFSRLREAHIGRHITIRTAKTGTPVVIPIHPVVREILDEGFDPNNRISEQRLNDHIKELCRLAGITNEVMVNRNVGGRNVEVTAPKYTFVSSHTARRSFATNAYKAGVPSLAIMKITGHTKESTFLKYIKVSEEENAELLSRHPFFS